MIVTDADSWMNAAIDDLTMDWEAQGHTVSIEHTVANVARADFCFCLGLGQLMPDSVRGRFKHVLVVHESDLPKGRGWSPLTWQILEGKDRIPVTLFEAEADVDSGPIYAQQWMQFKDHELIDELRATQASATHDICRWFVDGYSDSADQAQPQTGEVSYYPRRRPRDSELDPDKTLIDQFNRLRVVDNERYPAFFKLRGQRYVVRIERVTA